MIVLLTVAVFVNLPTSKSPPKPPDSEPNPSKPPEATKFPQIERDMVTIREPVLFKGHWDVSTSARLLEKYGLDSGTAIKQVLEKAPREVEIKPFYIDKYEVTNAQYQEFLKAAAGHRQYAHPDDLPNNDRRSTYADDPEFNQPDQPVVGIDWFDAYAYAGWAAKRLPTEDEWELAAGTRQGFPYPWGDQYVETKYRAEPLPMTGPAPVSRLAAAVLGQPVGMGGNVSEWVDEPERFTDQARFRGGAWNHSPGEIYALTFLHFEAPKTMCDDDLGFRCTADKGPLNQQPPEGMIEIEGGQVTLGGEDTPVLRLMRFKMGEITNLDTVLLRSGSQTVPMKPFQMDRHEVTNAEYRVFLQYVKEHGDAACRHPNQRVEKSHTTEALG